MYTKTEDMYLLYLIDFTTQYVTQQALVAMPKEMCKECRSQPFWFK